MYHVASVIYIYIIILYIWLFFIELYVQFFFLSVGHMHAQNRPMLKIATTKVLSVHLLFETTMSIVVPPYPPQSPDILRQLQASDLYISQNG